MPVKDLKAIYYDEVLLYYCNNDDDFDKHYIWKGYLKELPSEFESLEICFMFPYSDLLYVAIKNE